MMRVSLHRAFSSASAAARRHGGASSQVLTAKDAWASGSSKRTVARPDSWDPTLVDQVVSATAADIMRAPCVVSPKPQDTLQYVADDESSVACARIFWERKIGALLVKSSDDGRLVGIMSERDFVKALATETVGASLVRDLMTPVSKMVTVSLSTGVGECMELMRAYNIRHLPVMAAQDKTQSLKSLKGAAER